MKIVKYNFNTIKDLININIISIWGRKVYNKGVQSKTVSSYNIRFNLKYNSLFKTNRPDYLINRNSPNVRSFSSNGIVMKGITENNINNDKIRDISKIENLEQRDNIGNIIVNSEYGFFIREVILGNLDRNNKFIKVNKEFFNKLSKVSQFQKNRKGISSYSESLFVIGSYDVFINKQLFIDRFQQFLQNIPDGMVVSILPQIYSTNKLTTLCNSMHVLNNTDSEDIGDYFYSKMIESINNYPEIGLTDLINNPEEYYDNSEVYDSDLRIVLSYKIWLDKDDYRHLSEELIKQKMNKIKNIIDNDLKFKLREVAKNSSHDKLFGITNKSNLLNIINNMMSIYNYLEINNDLYGILNDNLKSLKVNNIYDLMDIKFNNYCIVELNQVNYNEKIYILVNKKTIVEDLNLFMSEPIRYHRLAWKDKLIDKNNEKFIRELLNKDRQKFYFENNNITYIEIPQFYPDLPIKVNKITHNDKIGSLDFETYLDENNKFIVFAGGISYKFKDEIKYFDLYGDTNNNLIGDNLVMALIDRLFEEHKINGYTFYSHNLSRFDGLFLVSALSGSAKYKLKGTWKDNGLIKLVIINIETNDRIIFIDSLKIVNCNLDKALKAYGCNLNKGILPYLFYKHNTLHYIGKIPEYKNYCNISIDDYTKLVDEFNLNNKLFDARIECLEYLKIDVLGLLELMIKLSNYFNEEFNYNLTDKCTIPGIAYDIWGSNFYDQEIGLKVLKGDIVKDIRESYFGGNVNVYKNIIKTGYHYDINSQYPFAQCNFMPVGNPLLSTNPDLNYYFGFVYAEIIPPINSPDQDYILLHKNEKGERLNSRTPFKSMIFSEELKQAINEFGYKCTVYWGYHFPHKSNDNKLLKNFVNTFYMTKSKTEEPVKRLMAKLILNSNYGKFGQGEITSKIEIVNRNKGEEIMKKYKYNEIININENFIIIKYGERLNETLVNIIRQEENEILTTEGFKKKRGIPSNIAIAAATAAYARMELNKYRKITKIVYTDTDSIITEEPLDSKYIGTEIGKMKLENIIIEGYFIKKKLYGYLNINGEEKIVVAGLKKSTLNIDKFRKLASGHNIIINQNKFLSSWKDFSIKLIEQPFSIQGLKLNNTNLLNGTLIPYKQINSCIQIYKEPNKAIIPYINYLSSGQWASIDYIGLIPFKSIKSLELFIFKLNNTTLLIGSLIPSFNNYNLYLANFISCFQFEQITNNKNKQYLFRGR